MAAALDDDADEDVFLLEGNFDGAFIQGQTITVTVETDTEQTLLVGLKAFRAARALEVAEEIEPGVWTLSFTVPPEYSGRFFAVHVKGLGVLDLDYTIGFE